MLHFGRKSTAQFTKATPSRLPNLGNMWNPKNSIFSVASNAHFTTLAGKFFFVLIVYILINAFQSLHAGVSTMEPQQRQAISFSAFVDAVEEYERDSETDDEGDMIEA